MVIKELRILPPLAIGRLGAATRPMDNYEVLLDPDQPLAPRQLLPAPTFEVDPDSGAITSADAPPVLRFTEDGNVRPVAPFLEVWALTSDPGRDDVLEPLTIRLLEQHGLGPEDVRWSVHVANHKIYRRTGDKADRIDAEAGPFHDHAVYALNGTCANFWEGKKLPLGHVRYIKPTPDFPGIRLRFTPAAGHVYGSSKEMPPPEPDPNLVDVLYNAKKGRWLGYFDNNPTVTVPSSIYAGSDARINGNDVWVSAGYLDDECDGLVRAELTTEGTRLTAYARVGAGPPAYAPDSFPVRSVADELEQAMFGPTSDEDDATLEAAEDVVRRAFDTVRLMNTAVLNGNAVNGLTYAGSTMVAHDTGDTGRVFEPIMAPPLVDRTALLNLHQQVLTGLRSGTAPWFADVLRDFDEVGDLSTKGRRKMPALMRGADGRSLALTRRQVDIVRKVARRPIFTEGAPGGAAAPDAGAKEQG
ncbi:hypothetical protein IPZ58_16255 [Streptomyces roseoverticillatus]|uniref:hypothetical protein n=1 Tax=Streptomyces roseoverticillatus TaxID=66429 RepID=UPI001F194ED7|nr:hypothetical protein [Streptomyces roseoverticillatus]MCF3103126.1 hypothetical protein [Streptomyces roseoverticillatus]